MTPFDKALMDLIIAAYTIASIGFIIFSMLFCVFAREEEI